MPQNTSQNRISEKKRDFLREKVFKDAYGLDTHIYVTNINDVNWDWVQVILNFRDTLGKNYGLIEYFKEGTDNSTKSVDLEDDGKIIGSYKRFLDAELALVDLIRKRIQGNG